MSLSRLEVAYVRGNRQVEVRLIFGVPVEMEEARHFRAAHGQLLYRRKELFGRPVRQGGKGSHGS